MVYLEPVDNGFIQKAIPNWSRLFSFYDLINFQIQRTIREYISWHHSFQHALAANTE